MVLMGMGPSINSVQLLESQAQKVCFVKHAWSKGITGITGRGGENDKCRFFTPHYDSEIVVVLKGCIQCSEVIRISQDPHAGGTGLSDHGPEFST